MYPFLINIFMALGIFHNSTTSANQLVSPLPNRQAEVCGHIPKGTGLVKNGEGWIHIMKTGYYSFPHAQLLNRDKGKQLLKANQTYYVLAHEGKLEWIDSDGIKSIVPQQLLFPPYEKVKII